MPLYNDRESSVQQDYSHEPTNKRLDEDSKGFSQQKVDLFGEYKYVINEKNHIINLLEKISKNNNNIQNYK